MRLINVETFKVEEFLEGRVPPYAILSHTWLPKGEVKFSDMADSAPRPVDMPGWYKIQKSAEQAKEDGHAYIWVDTCCIDKSSSAELSEAINSMFAWYVESAVCYAFLSDVPTGIPENKSIHSLLEESRWFTRGWTLQELLAPRKMRFYASDWSFLGTKSDLRGIISEITGINGEYLLSRDIFAATAAERMSWASKRTTTRKEDMAYCLLGIFGINMPLLYGERDRAFIRLQKEIIANHNDLSILSWEPVWEDFDPEARDEILKIRIGESQPWKQTNAMATSVRNFTSCQGIVKDNRKITENKMSMSNMGIHVELPVFRSKSHSSTISFYAILPCRYYGAASGLVAIELHKPIGSLCMPTDTENTLVYRTQTPLFRVSRELWDICPRIPMIIMNKHDHETIWGSVSDPNITFAFRRSAYGENLGGYTLTEWYPARAWNAKTQTLGLGHFSNPRRTRSCLKKPRPDVCQIVLLFSHQTSPSFAITVRVFKNSSKTHSQHAEVQCHIARTSSPGETAEQIWMKHSPFSDGKAKGDAHSWRPTRWTDNSGPCSLGSGQVAIANVSPRVVEHGHKIVFDFATPRLRLVTLDVEVLSRSAYYWRFFESFVALTRILVAKTMCQPMKICGANTRNTVVIGRGEDTCIIDTHSSLVAAVARHLVPSMHMALGCIFVYLFSWCAQELSLEYLVTIALFIEVGVLYTFTMEDYDIDSKLAIPYSGMVTYASVKLQQEDRRL